jgi:tRNA(Ile)-lysidine synthase TilS/MesJ
MEPRVTFFDGLIILIRPLIYLPEKELARYARAAGYPEPTPCPQGEASKRAQVAAFLRQFGREQEQIRTNLWRVAREAMGF